MNTKTIQRKILKNSWKIFIVISFFYMSCTDNTAPANPDENDALSGGATTIFDATSKAFANPAPNLSAQSFELHQEGDVAFEAKFVTAPATINSGLGPIYNNIACVSCHASDGRGTPPNEGEELTSMLFRLSIPGFAPDGGPNPAPGFGGQLQPRAVIGSVSEGNVRITYKEIQGAFPDGEKYSLRQPTYTIINPYTALPAGLMISPRVAPPVFGLGLLEAVPESSILAIADESDANKDGISGRPNYVFDVTNKRTALGRFGLKCNMPNLRQQNAGAYNGDMGITSSVFPDENSVGQVQAIPAHAVEVDDKTLDAVVHYTRTLAVPSRRNTNDETVKRGKQLFMQANCLGCHTPTLKTGTVADIPEISNQTIHPYTDLLLHDMGDELSDGRPDYLATANEWRTSPLWGIGLTELVNGHSNFLHDGRARNFIEAILWHGGEASTSREYFKKLPQSDRKAIIAFLRSL
ncbi:MAG: c-type cytochrome [Bacteroidetes bacterium]|nr:c-type cytochrome [Bacteroidota bacterium]